MNSEIFVDEKKSEPVPKLRFEVKKIGAVGLWAWDIQNDMCAICRNNLADLCIECHTCSISDNKCNIVWGVCNHTFHVHCISRWLKNRTVCPLCNDAWDIKQVC